MSLILEALKKSEDKRRLGAAPDLATPFSAPRRRSWVWPLAALIVVAGVVAWALRPSAPPPTPPAAAVPPKTKAPVVQAAPTTGQKTGAPLRSVTGNNDLVQSAPPDNLPKAAPPPANNPPAGQFVFGQPSPNAAAGSAVEPRRGAREGMRERRGGLANRNAAKTPAPNAVAAVPPKENVAAPAPAPATTAPKASPAPVPPVAAPEPPKAAAVAPAAKQPAAAAAAPSQPAEAPSRAPKSSATIGLTPPPPAPAPNSATTGVQPYAELPFSTRKSLPELKLSMHVYAADPSHRFVVLNDSRLIEGEKTNDDIFVREIRPDGVVLEFQNQRFFFPRDGL